MALIIGNGAYRGDIPQLANPEHDAKALAAMTHKLGYQSLLVLDANRDEMRRAVDAFAAAAKTADMALVFYSGHAFELKGRNLLLPVDFKLSEQEDVETQAFPLTELDKAFASIKGTTLLFIDACRDDPFKAEINLPQSVVLQSRGVQTPLTHTKGLADQSADYVTALMYATEPGRVALDGTGETSPFTTAILENLPTAGRHLRAFLGAIRVSVSVQTQGAQVAAWNTHFVLPDTPLYQVDPQGEHSDAVLAQMATETHPASGAPSSTAFASLFPGISLTVPDAAVLLDTTCDTKATRDFPLGARSGNVLMEMSMANGPAPCVAQFFGKIFAWSEPYGMTVVRPPGHGTVTVMGNAVGYLPEPGFKGIDSFECNYWYSLVQRRHATINVSVR